MNWVLKGRVWFETKKECFPFWYVFFFAFDLLAFCSQRTAFRFSVVRVNKYFINYPNSLGFSFEIPYNVALIQLFDKYFHVFLQNIKACILKGKSLPLNFSITEMIIIQIPYEDTVEVTNRFKGLDPVECLTNYGQRFLTLCTRQWRKPSQIK